ncbi:MAG: SDR family NAD(P)-dependent oxidoreductase [Clostridia bacterium]|nr:SDR family NAD(P)-dependent oxidoreductase [Clostridia bacterium]
MHKDRSILITGAAGFIGFHLSMRLLKQGFSVVGFDNLNDYYDVSLKEGRLRLLTQEPNFTFVRGDLADERAVETLFDRYDFAYVVNLAAQAGVRYSIDNPRSYINSNVIGFFNLLEAVRFHPVEHLVYASSSSVYGNQEKTPFSTDDFVDHPISLYAATKKSNELFAHTYSHLYGIPATGLRFFTVYGPWGRPDMAYFKFTKRILAGETIDIYNHGDLYRDFTYVDDVVTGIEKLLPCPPEEKDGAKHAVYNIGNNNPENLLTFVETLEAVIGKTGEKRLLPMQPGDVYQTYADVEPLKKQVGFAPATPLREGLSRFYDWYRTFYQG